MTFFLSAGRCSSMSVSERAPSAEPLRAHLAVAADQEHVQRAAHVGRAGARRRGDGLAAAQQQCGHGDRGHRGHRDEARHRPAAAAGASVWPGAGAAAGASASPEAGARAPGRSPEASSGRPSSLLLQHRVGVAERLAYLPPAPVEAGAHGADRDAERPRDLPVRQIAPGDQQQYVAVLGGQGGQRAGQCGRDACAVTPAADTVGRGLNVGVDRGALQQRDSGPPRCGGGGRGAW